MQDPVALLAIGIVVRLVTFVFLAPDNNDAHIDVIRFLVEHGRLALSSEAGEAYHPPLYYLLAAPFWKLFGSEKAVQFLSLILSIATLVVFYRLIYKSRLIREGRAQLYSFFLVCFLPQFVLFTLYVSNDTLAIFLGVLMVWQAHRFIQRAESKELLLLAILAGLGLLTKATFLAFVPVLLVLVIFRSLKAGSLAKAAWMAAAFLALALSLGSYKFVDNFLRFHDPLSTYLDSPSQWVAEQKTHYMGVRSFVDINLLHLLRSPTMLKQGGTATAFPVLGYATFWYQYVPESNFVGDRHAPFKYLGSLIYLAGLVPTVVFGVGLAGLVWNFPGFIRTFDPSDSDECRLLSLYVAAGFLVSNCGLILSALLKYHLWSIMQARLLFPSMMGAMGAFGAGVEMVRRNANAAFVLQISMYSLAVLFGLYLSSEIAFQLLQEHVPALKSVLKSL